MEELKTKKPFSERHPIHTRYIVWACLFLLVLFLVRYEQSASFEMGRQVGQAEQGMQCIDLILKAEDTKTKLQSRFNF